VPRALTERPEGIVYAPDVVPVEEEAALLGELDELRFDPIVMKGVTARRTARHYGLSYDYDARTPKPGEPVPQWLLPLRARAAQLADVAPDALAEVLVQRYPPGSAIGWHRDAPAFDIVVGVSLAGSCRMRFQRGKGEARRVWDLALEPRSGYVLTGPARRSWEHSIPPTKELRYSVTFRTLRQRSR
jgi:alkylated DNA repair dioxygenase AlkB